jgi:hypothetical protein
MAKRTESIRDQILRDFRQLLKAWEEAASRIRTKEELAEKAKDKEVVQTASQLTVKGIVQSLADLQLTFDGEVQTLANTLIGEASKLEQVRQAIEIETNHLQELEQIEVAANALDILAQEQREKAQATEERTTQQRTALDQGIAAKREAWKQEQEEYKTAVAEYEESLHRERSTAEADYAYERERKKKIELDTYEAKVRKQEREIAETEAQKQDDWTEREKIMAERSQELEEYKAQIVAFPQELESAIVKARDAAFKAARQEAAVQADLFKREVEANVAVRELKIRTQESTTARQEEQIEALSAELKEALERAQDLASKAVAGRAIDKTPYPGKPTPGPRQRKE